MRNVTRYSGDTPWDIEYPDNVVFAFNPLYIVIRTDASIVSAPTLYLSHGSEMRSVEVQLIKGYAKVYFSRILQLFFDDYPHIRTKDITAALSLGTHQIFACTFLAIWGSLRLGERYDSYGTFPKGNTQFSKTRVWFRHFPFTVTMFSPTLNPNIHGVSDKMREKHIESYGEGVYDAPIGNETRYGLFELLPKEDFSDVARFCAYYLGEDYIHVSPEVSVIGENEGIVTMANDAVELYSDSYQVVDSFDKSFDYTFHFLKARHKVNIIVREEQSGFYLRWIDHIGEIQYYLFTKGGTTIKNSLEKNQIADDVRNGEFPMNYPNLNRTVHVDGTITSKCCASSMPDNIYEYVKTIVTSPYIDMYGGIDNEGREIWIPVNIVSANHEFKHKDVLHDLIISFTQPATSAQTI